MFRRVAASSVLLALCAAPVLAQEAPDHEAMMKAWIESAKPGPNHAMLTSMAGTWDVEVTTYDDPSGPKKSKGTSVAKPLLDGRFLYEEMTGEMMGMPFQGIGITGYNNVTKKFELLWMDSMGTVMVRGEGDMKDGALVMTMEFNEPISGQIVTSKGVTTMDSNDKHTYAMYMIMDGKEMKSMEVVYTRKK